MVPADELVDLTQFSTPVLATSAVRLASRLRLADRITPPFNLVISNVLGQRQPVYFAGAQLRHQFPVSIVTDGQGLNITVVSYLDPTRLRLHRRPRPGARRVGPRRHAHRRDRPVVRSQRSGMGATPATATPSTRACQTRRNEGW
jgi:WS/DGAT C-terminal domain